MTFPEKFLLKKTCNLCGAEFDADHHGDRCPQDDVILTPYYCDPLIGATLADRYEIKDYLGQGGWSTVYRARHQLLGSDVAIKVLHGHLLNDVEKLQRFEQEAKILSTFDHSGIVRVLDYGLSPRPYIVMELCQGVTLHEYVQQNGRLSCSMFVSLFKKVCEPLQMAHEKELVHRDLKPSNIMIVATEPELKIKILDFGLVKMLDSAHTLTQTGEAMGSPPYMSPEHFQGDKLQASSDLYSLGCVMYESITGKPPFTGESTMEYMSKHLRGRPRSFAREFGNDRLYRAIEEIILTCMEKNPRDRYDSVDVLRRTLSEVEVGRFSLRHFPGFRRRRKRLSTLVVGSLLSIGTVGVTTLAFWPEINLWMAKDELKTGQNQLEQGNLTAADKTLNEALRRLAGVRKTDPLRLSTERSLIDCYTRESKLAEAETLKAQVWNDIGGNPSPSLLKMFNSAKHQMNVVVNLGQAEELALQALHIAQLEYKDEPAFVKSSCFDLLGQIQRLRHKFPAASDNLRTALKMREQLLPPNDMFVVQSMNNLGQLCRNQERYDEADALYHKALAICMKQNSSDWRSITCTVLNNLASNYYAAKNYKASENVYKQVIALNKQWFGANSEPVALTIHNLSQVHCKLGKLDEAITEINQAMQIYDKAGLADNPDREANWTNLARMYAAKGRFEDSEKCYRKAIALREKSDPDHPSLRKVYGEYAVLLRKVGRSSEADAFDIKANDLLAKSKT